MKNKLKLCTAVLAMSGLVTGSAVAAEVDKPNILFIMGDDIGIMNVGRLPPRADGRGDAEHRPPRRRKARNS